MTTTADIRGLVERVIERLQDAYVFPDRSMRAAELLRTRLNQGAYDVGVGPELCERISADLFAASEDKHLRLLWHDSIEASADDVKLVAAVREQFRLENHGLRRVERLPGNIGLIALTLIPELSEGGAMLANAMSIVERTQALIVDLRATRGGSPDGVAFLASYFFEDGDIHLSDIIVGPNGPVRQYWASAYLPSPRYLDRPVWVLTSASTFSGGEALAYDLQAHGRATLVGEPTRGGAHPSEVVSLAEHIELRLPVARTVSAVTGTNWEAIGVLPDIETPAADALEVAHQAALGMIIGNANLSSANRFEAEQHLEAAGVYTDPFEPAEVA